MTGLGSASYDVFAAGDRDKNYYLWGAMGGSTSLALGLALAQPDKSVVVITGDGEQLMGIGSLATIAAKQPRNLTIVVLDNGHFGETGMQRSHTSLGTDLVAVAKGFGIADALRRRQHRALRRDRRARGSRAAGHHFRAGRHRGERAAARASAARRASTSRTGSAPRSA